jgi:hypothetical protein
MPLFADTVDAVLEGSVVGSFTRIGPWVRRHTDDWTPLEELPGAAGRSWSPGRTPGWATRRPRRSSVRVRPSACWCETS